MPLKSGLMVSASWMMELVLLTPTSYMANAIVRQLGRGNALENTDNRKVKVTEVLSLKSYTFIDMFPTEISSIDLSYDSTDTIEEFTVTFAFQYYVVGYKPDGLTEHSSAGLIDKWFCTSNTFIS